MQRLDRRSLLSGLSVVALNTTSASADDVSTKSPTIGSPSLSITIDDFEVVDTPWMTKDERHRAILDTLEKFNIKAAGFPAGKFIDNGSAQHLLHDWVKRGHILGNHTYSHKLFDGKNFIATELLTDLLRAETILKPYPGYQKLFRFPYLAEGDTPQARDDMRSLLINNGYVDAYVTIDTSDWYINSRMVKRLKGDSKTDLKPFKDYYIDHLWKRANFYDGLAKGLLGSSIAHTILLHHNLTTSFFLGDVLSMFSARGWNLVDAERTFHQPLFGSKPAIAPAGQSLIWALAQESNGYINELRYPGEDDSYEKPQMDTLNL